MTSDIIEKFVDEQKRQGRRVRIHFKERNTLVGLFIKSRDYLDMKKKNFWRIVPDGKVDEWKNTRDNGLSRLFNGAEFTKLSDT